MKMPKNIVERSEFSMRKGWSGEAVEASDDAWNMNYENLKALSMLEK